MSLARQFLIGCVACGRHTSRAYARTHEGKCKPCFTGQPRQSDKVEEENESFERRNARLIDSGFQAYAREEGYYNTGDY